MMWWMKFVQCANFLWSASCLLCVANILVHLLQWAWLKWKSTKKDWCIVLILNDCVKKAYGSLCDASLGMWHSCHCIVMKRWEANVVSQENSYHIRTAFEKYPVHILSCLYFFKCTRIDIEHNYMPCLSGLPSANFVTRIMHNHSCSGLQKLFCWHGIIMQCVNQRK
jgi:hypothetical protein